MSAKLRGSTVDQAWRVVVMAGAAGVGKSWLAVRLAHEFGGACLQADDVRLVLQAAIPVTAEPELHYFRTRSIADADPDEALEKLTHIAAFVSKMIQPVIAHHLSTAGRVIIEGDALTPELAADVLRTTPGRARAVVLHEPDATEIEVTLRERGRGFGRQSAEEQVAWVRLHHAHGNLLVATAEALGLPIVTSRPKDTLLPRVVEAARL